MNAVELFAGAGGLTQGLHHAGFRTRLLLERDEDTCLTLEANKARGFHPLAVSEIVKGDVEDFNYEVVTDEIDLIAGGPPCQPFSLGGKHRAYRDRRDMFPEAIRAIREVKPRAFIFENVKGLTRASFQRYFVYIQLQLTYPLLVSRRDEPWLSHLSRLEQHHTWGKENDFGYRVVTRLLNAADFGVPQHRERVFFVGFRNDIQQAWAFPEPTHSRSALMWQQAATNEYWDRHGISPAEAAALRPRMPKSIPSRKLWEEVESIVKPWRTVRDALSSLPDPELHVEHGYENHHFRAGARAYPGHTGSRLDTPAKTLKAGDHGVPGGENMLVLADGRVRYFTVRESARLQTFPDDYFFPVSWTESMRQLGNAVPVRLGSVIASSVANILRGKS